MEWIVIPDLSTRQLSLSSLILGLENVANKDADRGAIQWSVDKKFAQNSSLSFMTFIYNASNNLAARIQVYRDGKTIISTPFKPFIPDKQSDPQRLPFNSVLNLAGLAAGRYTLEVTIEDRTSHKTTSQTTAFYIQ